MICCACDRPTIVRCSTIYPTDENEMNGFLRTISANTSAKLQLWFGGTAFLLAARTFRRQHSVNSIMMLKIPAHISACSVVLTISRIQRAEHVCRAQLKCSLILLLENMLHTHTHNYTCPMLWHTHTHTHNFCSSRRRADCELVPHFG